MQTDQRGEGEGAEGTTGGTGGQASHQPQKLHGITCVLCEHSSVTDQPHHLLALSPAFGQPFSTWYASSDLGHSTPRHSGRVVTSSHWECSMNGAWVGAYPMWRIMAVWEDQGSKSPLVWDVFTCPLPLLLPVPVALNSCDSKKPLEGSPSQHVGPLTSVLYDPAHLVEGWATHEP